MITWNTYKNRIYSQQQARKMDYELDLLHGLISDLYNREMNTKDIRDVLDKIAKNVHTK